MAVDTCLWRDGDYAIYQKNQSICLTRGKDWVATYGLDGRLFSLFDRGHFYQRSLSNLFLHKGRNPERFRLGLSLDESHQLNQDIWNTLSEFRVSVNSPAQTCFDRIYNWTPERLKSNGDHFHTIYKPISILPPDQYLSLVLQLSEGCSYNRCSFCNFYKDRPFRIKSMQEFADHLQAVADFLGAGIALRQGVFLADGDALMTPQKRLMECISLIRMTYPDLPIYSFMDGFRPQAKSLQDWQELQTSGLKRVYLGIETAHGPLLSWLEKPGHPDMMFDEVLKLKQADLQVGLIFMIGAGGQTYRELHRQDSLQWLRELPLDSQDFIFLSEFIPHPDQPYVLKAQSGQLPAMSVDEIKAEIRVWNSELKACAARRVPYHLQEFIY